MNGSDGNESASEQAEGVIEEATGAETPSEHVKIGEAPIREAKRLQAALAERGVAVRLASDPEQCNSCSPKIMMSIHRSDLAAFQALMNEERARAFGMSAEDVAAAASSGTLRSEAVFDPEKEDATCPACGTVFSTRLTECPDCGLGFALG
jgi:hypothetical protein